MHVFQPGIDGFQSEQCTWQKDLLFLHEQMQKLQNFNENFSGPSHLAAKFKLSILGNNDSKKIYGLYILYEIISLSLPQSHQMFLQPHVQLHPKM